MSDLEIKEYRFQPTDETGRPIGGIQVIKYTNSDELAEKLKEQNVLLIRKLRQETKKNRLGILETDELPENTPIYEGPVEFTPRELTEEERYEIARDLIDPAKATSAATKLFEAQLGGSSSDLAKKINNLSDQNLALTAKIEVNSFIAETPEYYKCQENFETLTSYMVRYNLYPVKENFKLAFHNLLKQGAMILGPAPEAPEAPEAPIAIDAVEQIPIEPVIQPVAHSVPTGLTREQGSDNGPQVSVGDEITYTVKGVVLKGLDAVNAMSGEEYGRRLRSDKNFGKTIEKLEAEARKNKAR